MEYGGNYSMSEEQRQKEARFVAKLPKEKVILHDFYALYRGEWHEVESVNKQKKTAHIYSDNITFLVNLAELDDFITHEEYINQ